jgi:hypothetical protein
MGTGTADVTSVSKGEKEGGEVAREGSRDESQNRRESEAEAGWVWQDRCGLMQHSFMCMRAELTRWPVLVFIWPLFVFVCVCGCQLSIEESQVDEQGLDGHEPILTYTPDANAETGGGPCLTQLSHSCLDKAVHHVLPSFRSPD